MKKDIYSKLKKFSIAKFIGKMHPEKKLQGIIFGNFGAMNQGDEAILAGELRELRTLPNINISVVARNPKNVEKIHKATSMSLFNIAKIINTVRRSDFVIIGGGGLICKADRGFIGISYQVYMLLTYILLPKLFGKKTYAMGIGVYQNANPFILTLATRLLKNLDFVSARDHHSYHLLKKANVQAILYKDNSFLMDLISQRELLSDPFIAKNYNKNNVNIGMALLKPENKEDEKRTTEYVLTFLKKYKHATVWFYACDYQGNYFNDRKFAELIINKIKKENTAVDCIQIPVTWNPKKLFSSFQLMDHMITMRLHASIFAYRQKVSFTSISYDEKCKSFLDAIGKKSEMVFLKTEDPHKMDNFTVRTGAKQLAVSLTTFMRRSIYILLGTVDNLLSRQKNTITVLSYHSVMDDDWRFSIDVKEIRKQITYLYSRYKFITLKDLEEYIKGKKQIMSPSIILTFDDGYKDVLKLKPFLTELGVKPALFVLSDPEYANTEELGTKRPHLSKNDILSLNEIGWEIGSHTRTHPNLSQLSEEELINEIITSKMKLEKDLDMNIRYIAYPRGKYNNDALAYVKKAGYQLGLTMDDGIITKDTDRLLIPRVGVDRTHSFHEFKTLFSPSNVDFRRLVKTSFIGRYI